MRQKKKKIHSQQQQRPFLAGDVVHLLRDHPKLSQQALVLT